MIDKYTCACCGGRIDPQTMTCDYCGTKYKDERNNLIRVETFTNPVRTIAAKTVIPSIEAKCIGAEETARIAMGSIQQKISAALTDVMRYDIEFKPEINAYQIAGQVRCVIPKDTGINGLMDTFERGKR